MSSETLGITPLTSHTVSYGYTPMGLHASSRTYARQNKAPTVTHMHIHSQNAFGNYLASHTAETLHLSGWNFIHKLKWLIYNRASMSVYVYIKIMRTIRNKLRYKKQQQIIEEKLKIIFFSLSLFWGWNKQICIQDVHALRMPPGHRTERLIGKKKKNLTSLISLVFVHHFCTCIFVRLAISVTKPHFKTKL